jgi:hypothetical protein
MRLADDRRAIREVERLRSLVGRDFGTSPRVWGNEGGEDVEMADGYYLSSWAKGLLWYHHFKRHDRQTSLLELNFGPGCHSAIGLEGRHSYLLRTARALASGQREEYDTVEIDSREYYLVGRMGPGIGFSILDFYLAGALVDSGETNASDGDLGPEQGGSRRACVVIPKHHSVALAARQWLEDQRFHFERPRGCRPDFYVSKSGRRYVVEVKPAASVQNAALAIGQLTVYSALLGADGKIAIFPKAWSNSSKTWLDRYDPSIEVVYV